MYTLSIRHTYLQIIPTHYQTVVIIHIAKAKTNIIYTLEAFNITKVYLNTSIAINTDVFSFKD